MLRRYPPRPPRPPKCIGPHPAVKEVVPESPSQEVTCGERGGQRSEFSFTGSREAKSLARSLGFSALRLQGETGGEEGGNYYFLSAKGNPSSMGMAKAEVGAPQSRTSSTRSRVTQSNSHPDGRLSPALKQNNQDGVDSTKKPLLLLALIFLTAAAIMFIIYINFPQLSEEERGKIKLPKDMDDAKALGQVLSKYKETFYVQVMVAFFSTYIFLQTFAIPGSIFLSILSGFLYPFPLALLLVCLCSGLGASFCYMLSYLVGRPIVHKYLSEKAAAWSDNVNKHREHLLNYIIFLRITPFLPNWFINITSPVINVPLGVFFVGTFIGVAPPSFIAIQGGTTLYQLTTAGDAVSWNSVLVLMLFAGLSLLPVFLKNKLKQKFQ
ncbi:transmembrane protein 41B isoform X2 [Lampetra planeri]